RLRGTVGPIPEPATRALRGRTLVLLAAALASVLASACTGSQASNASATYRNPVDAHDAPDPSVIRAADGFFYAYTTQSIYPSGVLNLPILRSPDLVHWQL